MGLIRPSCPVRCRGALQKSRYEVPATTNTHQQPWRTRSAGALSLSHTRTAGRQTLFLTCPRPSGVRQVGPASCLSFLSPPPLPPRYLPASRISPRPPPLPSHHPTPRPPPALPPYRSGRHRLPPPPPPPPPSTTSCSASPGIWRCSLAWRPSRLDPASTRPPVVERRLAHGGLAGPRTSASRACCLSRAPCRLASQTTVAFKALAGQSVSRSTTGREWAGASRCLRLPPRRRPCLVLVPAGPRLASSDPTC